MWSLMDLQFTRKFEKRFTPLAPISRVASGQVFNRFPKFCSPSPSPPFPSEIRFAHRDLSYKRGTERGEVSTARSAQTDREGRAVRPGIGEKQGIESRSEGAGVSGCNFANTFRFPGGRARPPSSSNHPREIRLAPRAGPCLVRVGPTTRAMCGQRRRLFAARGARK